MRTAILISSCDAFSDCWEPMVYSFKKFWPDCPYPIFIISNFKKLEDKSIHFLNVGEDKGFGSNTKRALELIETEHIIFFLDDFFINDTVDNVMVNDHLNHCIQNNIDFLKIDYRDIIYRDELRVGESIYCVNPLNIRYSLNTAIAIWKRDALYSLCAEGYTAWDFERKGIDYLRKNNLKINSETILSAYFEKMTIRKICGTGAVCKGRWTNDGLIFLKENGFSYLIPNRKIEGKFIRYLTSLYKPGSIFWLPFGLLLRIIYKLKINI
jgi:hypothetical protein